MIKNTRGEQLGFMGDLREFNYLESTNEEKINLLNFILPDGFEVREDDSNGNVFVFNSFTNEYLYEEGIYELSLHILIDDLIAEHIQGDSLY
jgi:hypothetical protein